MLLTVDDVLERIGGYEKYQKLLLLMFGYVAIALDCFPTMIVTFITAEPDWMCVQGNNSMCNFTQPITLTSDDYTARCYLPRKDWTYVAGFTSTVTEVSLACKLICWKCNRVRISLLSFAAARHSTLCCIQAISEHVSTFRGTAPTLERLNAINKPSYISFTPLNVNGMNCLL